MSNAMVYPAGVSSCTPQCQDIVLFETDLLSCSAYELLRYPGVTASNLSHVIPELANIDPLVLMRVQIEGISITFPNMCSC